MSPLELHRWRVGRGMTQQDLAARLDVEPNSLARWERGERRIPAYLQLALKGMDFTHGPACNCTRCYRLYPRPVRARDPR